MTDESKELHVIVERGSRESFLTRLHSGLIVEPAMLYLPNERKEGIDKLSKGLYQNFFHEKVIYSMVNLTTDLSAMELFFKLPQGFSIKFDGSVWDGLVRFKIHENLSEYLLMDLTRNPNFYNK